MKYTQLKNITGKVLIEENVCDYEVDKYITQFGYMNILEWNEENEKWIEDNIKGGIKFLLNKNFIEKENKFKYDENKLYFAKDYDNDICKLTVDVDGESFCWASLTNNEVYLTFDNFDDANSDLIESNEEKDTKVEIRVFDTLFEAMEFYLPLVPKEKPTKLNEYKELKRLSDKFNLNIDCRVMNEYCSVSPNCGVPPNYIFCKKCPFRNII